MEPAPNQTLAALIHRDYRLEDVRQIRSLLERHGTFRFPMLENGLFPAGGGPSEVAETSGYHRVWVRDNVFIAHAHLVNGQAGIAGRTAMTLARFFVAHRTRFDDVIAGRRDVGDPMERPHVRFDGEGLEEIEEPWAHAQNDALGYFLWLYCRLARTGVVEWNDDGLRLASMFVRFLRAIRFWEDRDSGHWEETRKVSASSIGVVVGALTELKRLIEGSEQRPPGIDSDEVAALVELGRVALNEILPNECVQPDHRRAHDAALLFLIYPVAVVDRPMADQIIAGVVTHLRGANGIRRYQGDSYWCADYKEHLTTRERTRDFSRDIETRDALLKVGDEAQWCIFDPILSVIHGERFHASRDRADLARQVDYLNRSLGQVTPQDSPLGAYKCPEAYYKEHGRYVPNDHTPLLWTQANLWIALQLMEESLAIAPER